MSEKFSMDIRVSMVDAKVSANMNVEGHSKSVLEEAMDAINRIAEGEPQWTRRKFYNGYQTTCEACEEDILSVFHALIGKYPRLDLYASYSYDIREDDHSAQWWRTVKIQTEHRADGTATLDVDSSTNWF